MEMDVEDRSGQARERDQDPDQVVPGQAGRGALPRGERPASGSGRGEKAGLQVGDRSGFLRHPYRALADSQRLLQVSMDRLALPHSFWEALAATDAAPRRVHVFLFSKGKRRSGR